MKNRFTSTITTLILTLLISACGSEDITTAANTSSDTASDTNVGSDINTDTNVGSDINTDPVTNQDAMYSYNTDLSDAQPLSGAVLEQTTVYMFFDNAPQYSSMDFYCCKGIDGASTGEAHRTPVLDSSAPFVYSADLSQYSTTGTRELYVDRIRTDGSGIDDLYINFSINISTTPIVPIPNTPAIISGADTGSVTEDVDPDGDNLLEVSGKLNISDNDAGEAAFAARTVNGNYGSLTINTAGNWYYAANNTQTGIQSLTNGNTLRDRLTISSVDGTTHRIVITIIGADEANQPAVITGFDRGSVTEDVDPDGDNLLEVSGKLNITDNDAGEAAFIARTVNGNYGSLTINSTGNWNYAANNTQTVIQNLDTGSSLSDTLTVRSVDGTTHSVRITINGTDEANQPAVISGTDRGSVTEDVDPDGDNLLEVSGKLNITDNDAGEAAFTARTVNGNYGSLTINSTGNWNYAANNTQTVIQNLDTGSSLSDTLTVRSVDGTTHSVRITINGTDEANQPAVISGTDRGSVTEDVDPDGDNLLEVSGKLNITDNDAGEAAFTARTVNGNYGSLTINTTGNWNYAANNTQTVIQNLDTGSSLSDTLTVRSVDGTTHSVRITINGTDEANQPAVISGTDRGSVTEDVDPDGDNLLEVTGKLNITDNDAGEAAFTARTVNGNYGSLTINTAGNWNYAANNTQSVIQNLATGATLSDTLTVSSVDGTTHSVRITINGTDEVSTSADVSLSWVAPAEREDNTSISLSEIEGYKIYYGTNPGSYTDNVTINDGSATSYTFNSLSAGTYYFVVTTIDTDGRESQHSTAVTVTI